MNYSCMLNITLKGPKHEIFAEFVSQFNPVWVGDIETRPNIFLKQIKGFDSPIL